MVSSLRMTKPLKLSTSPGHPDQLTETVLRLPNSGKGTNAKRNQWLEEKGHEERWKKKKKGNERWQGDTQENEA